MHSHHSMRPNKTASDWTAWLALAGLFLIFPASLLARPQETEEDEPRIAPAVSRDTGLLLEPALPVKELSHEKFVTMMQTVGKEKLARTGRSAIVKLRELERPATGPLSHQEIRTYMQLAREVFDKGESLPVSDVGLISTQEDVIRQPMLNHIAAFENTQVRVYLLVQRTATDRDWSYFAIVQDMLQDPPMDYFGALEENETVFYGQNCYKCHSSGPLAIHPNRSDLVIDGQRAAVLGQFIAEQPRSQIYFPESDPMAERGDALELEFCSECHSEDGPRAPLYAMHGHPIRVLVDFGYMPPDRKLTQDEIKQLELWLEKSGPEAAPETR